MMVLLDTNTILDSLLKREPFCVDADLIMGRIRSGQVQGYVTATTLTDMFYIIKKTTGMVVAKQYITDIVSALQVCTVDRKVIEIALSLNLTDFEDAVQLACAINENLDVIITRDPQGFIGANLPVLSPREFLANLS